MTTSPHILVISFPGQSHINPALQFAKNLVKIGVDVTFVTPLFVHRRMKNASRVVQGLNIVSFSDGSDDGLLLITEHYFSELRRTGSEALKQIIRTSSLEGRPISCVVYSLLVEWVAEVARGEQLPSAELWDQPATVLDIYYHHFNGYGEDMRNCNNDPSWSIKLPGLPLLHAGDLPSLVNDEDNKPSLVHDENNKFIVKTFEDLIDVLVGHEKTKPIVLVNTFDSLEFEALRAVEKLNMRAIGPLVPSAFLEGKDPYLAEAQMEEIGRGLLKCGMPFLWVINKQQDKEKLSCMKELEEKGMIVTWCNQLEVLAHPSLGCFLTHCGWNSTLESLVSGVPVVAYPVWTDQTTNAKLIQDIWETGVRVKSKNGVVDGDEVHRCLELVMRGAELRRNAKKWSDLAKEAIRESGSSDKNLKAFVAELGSVTEKSFVNHVVDALKCALDAKHVTLSKFLYPFLLLNIS
ncbi:Glycosyltransferase [Heracleum sosnowskyi]|uniref:Glycosyltransferase n=1 Tax=Heracleum sosnowskyi TaxID=360622 RepID=A0AAD8IY99_9APIA|nr:Glycosyltransferase [Heracleum sosnowskyi]